MTPVEEQARNALFKSLRSLVPKRQTFDVQERLDSILNPSNDDGTAMAFDLEYMFKFKANASEWNTVVTVQDAIDLIVRHIRNDPTTPPSLAG